MGENRFEEMGEALLNDAETDRLYLDGDDELDDSQDRSHCTPPPDGSAVSLTLVVGSACFITVPRIGRQYVPIGIGIVRSAR